MNKSGEPVLRQTVNPSPQPTQAAVVGAPQMVWVTRIGISANQS
jgi:hypothetical protein